MFRTVDFKIHVTGQVVRQEADAAFHREQFAGERQQALFQRRQETLGGTQVTLNQSFKHEHAHRDLGDVLFIFRGGRRGRPDHVAEVVNGGTGHRGIQVNHANAFSGYIVQHHIVQLGIIVRTAQGQFPGFQVIHHHVAVRLAGKIPVYFLLHFLHAPQGVGLDGFFQSRQAGSSIVEIGNGFEQGLSGQVCRELLELAEGARRFLALLGSFNLVIRACAFNERVHAPAVAVRIQGVRLAVHGGNQRESAAVSFRALFLFQALQSVVRYALYILHQGDGLLEHIMVHALEDVADTLSRLIHPDAVGVIDVAAAVGITVDKIAAEIEQG